MIGPIKDEAQAGEPGTSRGYGVNSLSDNQDFTPNTPKSQELEYNPQAVKVAALYQDLNDEGKRDAQYLLNNLDKIPQPAIESMLNDKTEWTVNELLETDFPDPVWLVNDTIPTGLLSLAGLPKKGKSWLGLQLGVATASNGKFLDHGVMPGKVLYIAFEDPPRRLKSRLQLMGVPKNCPIDFRTDYRNINLGGLTDLYLDLETNDYKLVIIDTFGRFAGMIEVKDYAENVTTLAQLQHLAHRKGITILLIDHHTKLNSDNPTLDLIGSIGKAGSFDALIGLYSERGKSGAKLIVQGKDIQESELAIEFDALTHAWQYMGETQSVFKNEVLAAMRTLKRMGEMTTTTNIASHMGTDKGNVSRAIADLVTNGLARRLPKQGVEVPYEPL